MDIHDYIIRETSALGICEQGHDRVSDAADKKSLVGYYVENPDWCLERDFPRMDILKQHFSDCEESGVFVGKTFHGELLNDLQTYIFHGCKGSVKVGLNVEKAIIPMLYVANGCRLRVVGVGEVKPKKESERAAVPIYSFGHNDVSARDNRYVKFTRYKSELL